MNTKQQLESLNIWLLDAYNKGRYDALQKIAPDFFMVDKVINHFVEFTKAYSAHRYAETGDVYYVQDDRAYTLQEVINRFKLSYGYDEE